MADTSVMKKILFADVILPLALPELFTYSVPEEYTEKIRPGQRVVVQFGKQRIYAALVKSVHSNPPVKYQVKMLMGLIDEEPVITPYQFRFWNWIADYYLCTLGEIMTAALPSALRLQSETRIIRNPGFEGDESAFTDREFLIWEALESKPELSIKEIESILGISHVMPVVKNLLSKNAVSVFEEMQDKYKPRFSDFITVNPEFIADEPAMKLLMDQLEKKAPRQLELLMAAYHLSQDNVRGVPKTALLKKSGATAAVLKELIRKKILLSEKIRTDRIPAHNGEIIPPSELNSYQQQAYLEIKEAFTQDKTVLLHGITSSGKTEVYIRHIDEILKNGKQVLYLLPEIALTTQVIVRLNKFFGDKVLVYHSRYNDQERVEVWNKLLDNNLSEDEGRIVIGARSALFLPFQKLGLVIVDEEHEPSFKQEDPAPRYNARDAAIMLAQQQNAHVILGSATPSMESYFNALSGKYTLVNIERRYAELELPSVFIVDLKDARKRKIINGNFSHVLIDHIHSALKDKQQVILFQNRRGFAPYLECAACSWVPVCVNCDVSLTYHKGLHLMKCHYCGYQTSPPSKCQACGDFDMKMKGYGTERIEEELTDLIPDAVVARLDYDTTRSKTAFHKILNDYSEGQIDILVGTQMITKGLDFSNVGLVGILNADSLMNYPDFRSHERAFQLLAQVSGRAGRKSGNSKVIIQSFNPSHVVLQHVLNHDYKSFYMHELNERYNFSYPPYFRLIEIRLKHKKEDFAEKASAEFAKILIGIFGKRIMGPVPPAVSRVRNLFIRHITIRIEKTLSTKDVKLKLMEAIRVFKSREENRALLIQVDVDPV